MSGRKKDEVVATGQALRLAAQWLGTNEKEVIEQADAVEEPALGQFSGLGYRRHKVPKTKKKSVWKVDEHLTERLSSSKRQHERKLGTTLRRNQSQDPVGDVEEEGEEMGRSQMFSAPKKRKTSKDELLVAHKTRRRKKKHETL
ncbi:hypothetical protein M9434_001627 [Picochlorum sp. BPE23]|nr:hypothetical protein M9434_001627 [Picochlorum sp. BPE23]KAI8110342.1 hypothetical protein M9435_002018 [Picochlorum sp. BPE23]